MDQTTPRISLGIEELNAISTRLADRADAIHQFSLQDLNYDLRLAARCAELLAKIRFRIGELSEETKDPDTKLELRAILDAASNAEPGVGDW